MNKEYGGSAFPIPCACDIDKCTCSNGMSLRDYFAAAVLMGSKEGLPADVIAMACYNIADAMLVARSK